MKDKKIIAMFVTSAVALVASLVITLGVALTLADPVPAKFVNSCVFNYGSENPSEITEMGGNLVFEDAFVYSPSGKLVVNDWDVDSDTCDAPVYPLKNQEFGVELQVEDTVASKLEIAYVKVNNYTGMDMKVKVGASFNRTSELGKYTKVVVFDYATNLFSTGNDNYVIKANNSAEFAVILYTDTTDKFDTNELVFGEARENVSIVVSKVV